MRGAWQCNFPLFSKLLQTDRVIGKLQTKIIQKWVKTKTKQKKSIVSKPLYFQAWRPVVIPCLFFLQYKCIFIILEAPSWNYFFRPSLCIYLHLYMYVRSSEVTHSWLGAYPLSTCVLFCKLLKILIFFTYLTTISGILSGVVGSSRRSTYSRKCANDDFLIKNEVE